MSRRLEGVRIAFLCRRLPDPTGSGSRVYSFAVLAALRELGASIEILMVEGMLRGALPFLPIHPDLERVATIRVLGGVRIGTRIYRPLMSPVEAANWALKQAYGRIPALRRPGGGLLARARLLADPLRGITRAPSARELRFFRSACAASRPDVVLVDTVFLASIFSHAPFSAVPVRAVLTHDVTFERAANLMAAGIGHELSGWTRGEEKRRLRDANVAIAIQPDDARAFGELVGESRVVVLPMPIKPAPRGGTQIAGRLLFVGSDAEQNVLGIRWFVDNVLPLIRHVVPEATCEVVGTVARTVEAGPGLLRTGFVESLQSAYAGASVVIVPLLAGSGLKIKLVEALAHGRAVVTTSTGLQGVVSDEHVPFGLRADSAKDFAAACVQLLNDQPLRRAKEAEAQAWVAAHYSPDVAVAPFVDRVTQLLGQARTA